MREARRVIRGVNVPVHATFPAMRVGGLVRDGVAVEVRIGWWGSAGGWERGGVVNTPLHTGPQTL